MRFVELKGCLMYNISMELQDILYSGYTILYGYLDL